MAWSIDNWSRTSIPTTAGAIFLLTFSTALLTALPLYFSPPSRSSKASLAPVDAPEGTLAIP